jgi:hypothetical protein
MSKAPASSVVPVSQLPHPLRVPAVQPEMPRLMAELLGPRTWSALKKGFANPTRHTGAVIDDLVNHDSHPNLAQFVQLSGEMRAGTELGNAYAGLLALRQMLQPQPYFLLDDALVTLLERTDLAEDIPLSMLALPYPRFYIEFGRSRSSSLRLPNIESGMHILEGAYVETGAHPEFGDGLYVMLTGSPIGKQGPLDDATQGIYLAQQRPDMPLHEALAWSFHKSAELVANSPYRPAPTEFMQPSLECLVFLAKAILYLGLAEARRTNCPERSDFERAHAGLKSKAKKTKALRRAAGLVDHILVSAPPAPMPQEGEPPGAGSGRTVAAHWRRGHYRLQACGPQMSLRKLILLRPMLINAEQAGTPAAPRGAYEVR